ncbi:MAG: sigma 54-interacting transcriptional regulator [Lachnospiraceae bacterium]|jgi:transcriptional regulator of acetoin/glycerol metabolism|nr:sigma 54-interacting transcriptional regulator [Lachnospiraceae bacterium]
MAENPRMISQTLLKTISDSVKRFAEVIAKTVDADVRIVDHNLSVVGEAVLYYRLSAPVEPGCVIGQALVRQKRIVAEDRRQSEICRSCYAYEDCQIFGAAGIPVHYEGRVIGVIALLFPGHRTFGVCQDLEEAADFAARMAGLLAEQIRERDELAAVRRENREREQVLECVEDGVVCTDSAGEILFCNRAFTSMFGLEGSLRGENLQMLLPHRMIRECFRKKAGFRNLKIALERGAYSFYGFLSCQELLPEGEKRLVFCFRSMDHIWAAANQAGSGSLVTLEWCRGWIFTEEMADRAKALAATLLPVLICGPERCVNEMAAKAVCNYSDRSGMGIVPVYCNNLYREFFEQFLFSSFGELQRALGGTLVLYDVENLPFYLQERLLDFMKTGCGGPEGTEAAGSGVRLIFTTTKDLKALSDEGFFLEKLYYHLEKNTIALDSFYEDRARLAAALDLGETFYRSRYENDSVTLSRSARQWLLNKDWGEDPNEVDKILEKIVRSSEGTVTDKDLAAMGIRRLKEQGISAISDLEKERIAELLRAGYSKVEIAKLLGIGRATLYRKMAEYGLDYSRRKEKQGGEETPQKKP